MIYHLAFPGVAVVFACGIETAWKNSKSSFIQFKREYWETWMLPEGVIFTVTVINIDWVLIVMPGTMPGTLQKLSG